MIDERFDFKTIQLTLEIKQVNFALSQTAKPHFTTLINGKP